MTLEFKKGERSGQDICYLDTSKIDNISYPLYLTEENIKTIKELMGW